MTLIRIILTLCLVIYVGKETGPGTSLAILLIFAHMELQNIKKYLKDIDCDFNSSMDEVIKASEQPKTKS